MGAARAFLLAAILAVGAAMSAQAQILSFHDLDGWEEDDQRAALKVFQPTFPK